MGESILSAEETLFETLFVRESAARKGIGLRVPNREAG